MVDFHHNIFYYYRGARLSDQDRDRQLENNTTKAFINTLSHCSSIVAIKFLAWLKIKATAPILYDLQKESISQGLTDKKPQRLLLGISPNKNADEPPVKRRKSIDRGSLPDAWIYGNNFAVLVESKVVGKLNKDQMARHYEKLRSKKAHNPRCIERTWDDIYKFFLGLLDETENGLTKNDNWLITQFSQYLEWIGMVSYIGIKPEMFDHFAARPDVRSDDTKQWIRRCMQAFGERVRDKLQDDGMDFYQDYHIGNLKKDADHCWVALGPENLRRYAHQTLSLSANGLEIFINVEMKHIIKKLNDKIRRDKDTFRNIISNFPMPFDILIQEKEPKRPRVFKGHHIARLQAGHFDDPKKGSYGLADDILGPHGFDYLEMLLEKIHLPDFSVRRHIGRNQVLELSKGKGKNLVVEVTDLMKQFHPLIEFIHD